MHPEPIDERTVVSRTRELYEAELDGDLLALCVESGWCYGFNPTAAAIWRALAEPVAVATLIDAIVAEFAIDRVTCLAEGSVLAEGSLDQVSANPVVIERYLGR